MGLVLGHAGRPGHGGEGVTRPRRYPRPRDCGEMPVRFCPGWDLRQQAALPRAFGENHGRIGVAFYASPLESGGRDLVRDSSTRQDDEMSPVLMLRAFQPKIASGLGRGGIRGCGLAVKSRSRFSLGREICGGKRLRRRIFGERCDRIGTGSHASPPESGVGFGPGIQTRRQDDETSPVQMLRAFLVEDGRRIELGGLGGAAESGGCGVAEKCWFRFRLG